VPSTHRAFPLGAPSRRAVETALRYFDLAAPKHTADEEQSLFPRLRELAGDDPQLAEAMAKVAALEADHVLADEGHAEARCWFQRWLEIGTLAPAQCRRLEQVLTALEALYKRHIAIEDDDVFGLAGRVLDADVLGEIGEEMARRRGLRRETGTDDRAAATGRSSYRTANCNA
jgi:hemerythrin-like domain-containing protein